MWLDAADLHNRLARVTIAWMALLCAALALNLLLGDTAPVRSLSHSDWVKAHGQLIYEITHWGPYPFYVLFALLYLLGWQQPDPKLHKMAIGYLLAQLAGSVLVVRLLKIGLGRARPYVIAADPGADRWAGPTLHSAFHSFPSGHGSDLFTGAIFIAVLFRRSWIGVLAFGWAVIVGLTRVALARHYPSDVITGVFVGGIASISVLYLWVLPRLAPGGAASEGPAPKPVGPERPETGPR